MAIKQRRMEANYMDLSTDNTEKWEFMGTGFTELNENPGAQTNSKRYINDKSTSKSITGYEWQAEFNADLIESEKVVKEICDIARLQKTGADAERPFVIVDLTQKEGGTGNVYKARKIKVAIEVSKFGDDDGNMTCEGNLLGIGDVIPGTFDTAQKKFTATAIGG